MSVRYFAPSPGRRGAQADAYASTEALRHGVAGLGPCESATIRIASGSFKLYCRTIRTGSVQGRRGT
jgi:hypothetical protein